MSCECTEPIQILFDYVHENNDFAEIIVEHMHHFWKHGEQLEGNTFRKLDGYDDNVMYQFFVKWFYNDCRCRNMRYFWKECETIFEDNHIAIHHSTPGN